MDHLGKTVWSSGGAFLHLNERGMVNRACFQLGNGIKGEGEATEALCHSFCAVHSFPFHGIPHTGEHCFFL